MQKNTISYIVFVMLAVMCASPVRALTETKNVTPGKLFVDNGAVYLVSSDGTRRPFTSQGAFESYEYNSFSRLQQPTADELSLPKGGFIPPQEGKIFCASKLPKKAKKRPCYLITGEKKAGFTSEKVFKDQGYSFSYAKYGDESFVPETTPVSVGDVVHRPGTVINDGGTYKFILTDTGLLQFSDFTHVQSWGNAQVIVPANAADRGLRNLGNVPQFAPGDISIWDKYTHAKKTTTTDAVPTGKNMSQYPQVTPTPAVTSGGGGGGGSSTSSGGGVAVQTLDAPVFSKPTGSELVGDSELSIVVTNPKYTKATIYYTTDGTTPTLQSPTITSDTGKIAIPLGHIVLKAFATQSGLTQSDVTTAEYDAFSTMLSSPTSSVASGTYSKNQRLSLSANPGSRIFYTLDKSTPSATSLVYTTPIVIERGSTTVKAITVKEKAKSSPVATFDVTVSFSDPPQVISATSSKTLLGVTTVDAKYSVTNESSRLLEGVGLVKELGSRVLGIWMDPGLYPATPTSSTDFEDVVKSPAYKQVLDDPSFTTYYLTAHSKYTDHPILTYEKDSSGKHVNQAAIDKEKDEMIRLTRYLTENYPQKRFVIYGWEGDWFMQLNYDSNDDTSGDKTLRMIDWVNTRHAAIVEGRGGKNCDQSNVCDAVNFNLVKKDDPAKKTVLNSVVPFVDSDLVGYSAWTSIHAVPTKDLLQNIKSNLEYIKSKDPKKRPLFVSEFGTADQDGPDRVKIITQAFLDAGVVHALYWAMTDNNCTVNVDTTCSGVSLVYPGGVKSPNWTAVKELLK